MPFRSSNLVAVRDNQETAASGYEGLLGAERPSMPEILQVAHSTPLRADGWANVRYGRFGKAVSKLIGLPKQSEGQRVSLNVQEEGGRVRWTRKFGDDEWESVQSFDQDMMHEQIGGVCFRFFVRWSRGRVVYEQAGFSLWGVSLPRFVSPTVWGEVTVQGKEWRVKVSTTVPLFGLIHEYETWLTAE